MTRRILVNLIVFGLLGIVLTVWALQNVISLSALTRPYTIKAEFSSSPGLQPNFDVAYLGVTVGKIKSVHLADHKIVAELNINRGEKIPDNVTAAAGHQSAIGEPFVDLELPPGQTGGPPLHAGAVIPVSRTSVAVSYGDLFAAANKAVAGLNAQDLATFTHELALGWDGRAGSLQQILDSSSQITTTFGQNTALLDTLIRQLTETTTTMVQHGQDFGSGLDGLTAFTDALAASNGKLLTLRESTPDLLVKFNDILSRSRASDICTLGSLGSALPAVLNQGATDSLRYTQEHSPQLAAILKEISPEQNGKSNLNIDFVVTLDKPKPALEYKTPIPLPTVSAIPGCPGVRVPTASTASATKAGRRGKGSAQGGDTTTDIHARNAAGQGHGGSEPVRWLIYLPPLIALAVLVRMMGRAVPVLARRRRRRGD
jgi:phospholipid/cholesterol/gamma-HCH transport system substrate-binding protein